MTFANKNTQTNNLLNYYLTMNMNNICRICLEKSGKLTPIFDPVKPPHFPILMMACATVEVQEGDGLPPYICQRCISRLNIAYQFKTQCESSDTKLRQCFQNFSLQQQGSDFTGYQVKLEMASETGSVQNRISNEPNQIAQYDNELSNEQVALGQCQENKGKLKNLTVTILKSQSLPETSEQTSEEDKASLQELYQTVKAENLDPSEDKKLKKRSKLHQCNTCGKIFRTKPSLVHHIRIHTGERPYICHLCQKSFVNGGHLHTHMKIHTGEKNHICSACNKGFTTAQQLTKHTIAIHTSERPYGCTYCAKRFASSSNLNTHIKVHTGEKNFHCEICAKTFSTKGQLHQHLLVHTGEKAFLCEYCHKRFSQKAHLMRHLKIHIKTEESKEDC